MVSSTTGTDNPLLSAALEYAALGWRVIPLHHVTGNSCSCTKTDCGSPGKHPRTANGLKDGTTDAATIRRWWTRWPAANVGVCTGPDSGVWMLGPDGQAGIDAMAELQRQHGQLPTTLAARSGSGGRHYYFSWPTEGGIRNVRNHRGLPIDVRGAGGYFVAVPSANGNGPYVWEMAPGQCKPADAPDWLLAWCRASKPEGDAFRMRANNGASTIDRAVAYLARVPAAISGKGGHNQTMSAARAVVYGFDLGAETGYQLLRDHYSPRCQPPWTEKDLRHKCTEADTVPFDKPRGWLLDEENGCQSGNGNGNGNGTRPHSPPSSPHLTDTGNAQRMIAGYGEDLRHCLPWRKWSVWDGSQWRADTTAKATRCAKLTVATMYKEAAAEVAAIQQQHESEEE
jgi:hypothetical protein